MAKLPALKPQDVVFAVYAAMQIADGNGPLPSYAVLADTLDMSTSQVHASARRIVTCNLTPQSNLLDFLCHGVRYVFPVARGVVTRGIPTCEGALIPRGSFKLRSRRLLTKASPPVWPHPAGKVRGESIEPLYRNVPSLAQSDPRLHAAFALIDLLHTGGAREREFAGAELRALIY